MKQSLAAALAVSVQVSNVVCASPQSLTHLSPRDSNYTSSCGSNWMATVDVSTNHGEIKRTGYLTAVSDFCQRANGQIVPAGGYSSMASRVFLDGGGDPSSYGIPGYVFFEIHNKQSSTSHVVNAAACSGYLQQLSNTNSKCWGKDHNDTKGGTYQVGSSLVSYHALGQGVPPAQDAIEKLYTNGALSNLGGSGGAALTPFPLGFTSDITPVACHSHNDYTRAVPLYDALTAGCVSVEADVWLHGSNLRVSHTDPGDTGPTIQQLYLDPLSQLLGNQNTGGGSSKGVYPKNSTQSLVLLVDFKSDGDSTWDAVVSALQPLRNAGYLSHWDGSKFVQGPITVVASGNAPLAKAQNSTANPGRAVFMDARINESMDGYDISNTYYSSASFTDAITSSSSSPLSSADLQKLRTQLAAAHAKGFKARYWDIPSENQWQQLVDEGVDRLNVDDLDAVSGVDWHL